VYRKHNWQVWA